MSHRDKPGSVPVDLSAFLALFEQFTKAGHWKWFLEDGRKLRTKIDGHVFCPLDAIGYAKDRANQDLHGKPLIGRYLDFVPLTDQQKAAVVHHADGIACSRYWSQEFRTQLLRRAGIQERRVDRVYDRDCEGV